MAIYGNIPVRPAFPQLRAPGPAPDPDGKALLLYIHVPFCKTRCHYCAFHSQVFNHVGYQWYVKTLHKEIALWGGRLRRPALRTVFFGGGTPSIMPLSDLDGIMDAVRTHFRIESGAEVSIEANPDTAADISYFRALLDIGFNRLSLGVQSLADEDLLLLGRPHSAEQAVISYGTARRAGFNNISLDLMWGLPRQRLSVWLEQLKSVVKMRPDHISCYGLTVEPDTVFGRRAEECDLELPPEKEQGKMFLYGSDYLESEGYMHYEISNFARMGFECRHNMGYWEGTDYLGLGPSAVSTIGTRRFTNPTFMDAWDAAVRGGYAGQDYEELDEAARLREFVMLGLRTARGMDLKEYRRRTGKDLVSSRRRLIEALHANNLIRIARGRLRLTKEGMLVSNVIMERLAFPEE